MRMISLRKGGNPMYSRSSLRVVGVLFSVATLLSLSLILLVVGIAYANPAQCCNPAHPSNPSPPAGANCLWDNVFFTCTTPQGGACTGGAWQTAVAGACQASDHNCTANAGPTLVTIKHGTWGCP